MVWIVRRPCSRGEGQKLWRWCARGGRDESNSAGARKAKDSSHGGVGEGESRPQGEGAAMAVLVRARPCSRAREVRGGGHGGGVRSTDPEQLPRRRTLSFVLADLSARAAVSVDLFCAGRGLPRLHAPRSIPRRGRPLARLRQQRQWGRSRGTTSRCWSCWEIRLMSSDRDKDDADTKVGVLGYLRFLHRLDRPFPYTSTTSCNFFTHLM